MVTGPARRLKKGLGGGDEVPELGFSGVSRKELSKLSASQMSEVAHWDPLPQVSEGVAPWNPAMAARVAGSKLASYRGPGSYKDNQAASL